MDIDDALEPALDEPAPAQAAERAPPCHARWRRRGDGDPGTAPTRGHPEPMQGDPSDREPPFDAEPQRAPRDAELWELARRTHGAVVRLDVELRTALVRQVFRRDFVFVSRQLHALEASRRVQGLDRARLDDALVALLQRADDVQALLRRIGSELRCTIDTAGPADAHVAFARPARFQAIIVSPLARRYLALLAHADDTLARLEMAWLLGLVEPPRRSALASDCRRALHGFKELACGQRQAIGEAVRLLNAQRRHAMPAGDAE